MPRPDEAARLAADARSSLNRLKVRTTSAVRALRKEFSRRIAGETPETVLALALNLLADGSDSVGFFCWELVRHHRQAMAHITTADVLKLGAGLDSWSSVDGFATILSGPMWAQGKLSDKVIHHWAASGDRWRRRAALVSTVALSRRGEPDDLPRILPVCTLLVGDRDDMVVKALSWALREAAKKHSREVRAFLAEHQSTLAARVLREVNNKLSTGLKTPRRAARQT